MTSTLDRKWPADVTNVDTRSLRRIVFLSGRCVFAYGAMLDLMSWWAKERTNKEYAVSRIEDARIELTRGTDRTAVTRSLMHLFYGADKCELVDATRSFLRNADPRARCPVPTAVAELPKAGTEVVLISDLVLFALADELDGVDSLLSSVPLTVAGRLTGEMSLIPDGVERLEAMATFASTRGALLSECVLWHRGDVEDAEALHAVGSAVDLRSSPFCGPAAGRPGFTPWRPRQPARRP